MTYYFDYLRPSLEASELAMLDRILVRHCIREDVALSSFDASDAAVALMELFRHGVRNEQQLGKILGSRLSYLKALDQPPEPAQMRLNSELDDPAASLSGETWESAKDVSVDLCPRIICNSCNVTAQVDDRNDEKSCAHCPVCGIEFGNWAKIRARTYKNLGIVLN